MPYETFRRRVTKCHFGLVNAEPTYGIPDLLYGANWQCVRRIDKAARLKDDAPKHLPCRFKAGAGQ